MVAGRATPEQVPGAGLVGGGGDGPRCRSRLAGVSTTSWLRGSRDKIGQPTTQPSTLAARPQHQPVSPGRDRQSAAAASPECWSEWPHCPPACCPRRTSETSWLHRNTRQTRRAGADRPRPPLLSALPGARGHRAGSTHRQAQHHQRRPPAQHARGGGLPSSTESKTTPARGERDRSA